MQKRAGKQPLCELVKQKLECGRKEQRRQEPRKRFPKQRKERKKGEGLQAEIGKIFRKKLRTATHPLGRKQAPQYRCATGRKGQGAYPRGEEQKAE